MPVQQGVVHEVCRRLGLVRSHQVDKRLFAHRLQSVVVLALDPYCGDPVGAQVPSARGPGAMSGVDKGFVRQREQFEVQRIIQHRGQIRCGPPQRCQQVGTPDIANEQRVAGEDGMRRR